MYTENKLCMLWDKNSNINIVLLVVVFNLTLGFDTSTFQLINDFWFIFCSQCIFRLYVVSVFMLTSCKEGNRMTNFFYVTTCKFKLELILRLLINPTKKGYKPFPERVWSGFACLKSFFIHSNISEFFKKGWTSMTFNCAQFLLLCKNHTILKVMSIKIMKLYNGD